MTGEVVPFVQNQGARPAIDDLEDFLRKWTIGLHLVGGDGTILRANKAELA